MMMSEEIITKLSMSNCLCIKDEGPYLTHLKHIDHAYRFTLWGIRVDGKNLFFHSWLIVTFLDELCTGKKKTKTKICTEHTWSYDK